MPACANCGSHVSARFARVFGPADGDIEGCPGCLTMEELQDGAAAQG